MDHTPRENGRTQLFRGVLSVIRLLPVDHNTTLGLGLISVHENRLVEKKSPRADGEAHNKPTFCLFFCFTPLSFLFLLHFCYGIRLARGEVEIDFVEVFF